MILHNTCHVYTWTSPVTGTVTLAFQLRHDPAYWYFEDVSVYNNGSQMLINGCVDQISQAFTATTGYVYIVSFWLESGATGSVMSAQVTLS
jgi:hypothetical protein